MSYISKSLDLFKDLNHLVGLKCCHELLAEINKELGIEDLRN